jgi:D-alanyl-D-alanine dipeptidase
MTEDRTACYAALEQHFLTCRELRAVPVVENGEPMVALGPVFSGRTLVSDPAMRAFTGEEIYVRQALVPMLEAAQHALKGFYAEWNLLVVYGYRHLDIQTAKFAAHKARVQARFPELTGLDLDEAVHRFSAVPDVAGHPTGGAVDLCIATDDGRRVPMGTEVVEYSPDTYVFSPFIPREAWHNRQLLRTAMLGAGFAPFDGEWWHFSFGDREWARYYNRPQARYAQLSFRATAA